MHAKTKCKEVKGRHHTSSVHPLRMFNSIMLLDACYIVPWLLVQRILHGLCKSRRDNLKASTLHTNTIGSHNFIHYEKCAMIIIIIIIAFLDRDVDVT